MEQMKNFLINFAFLFLLLWSANNVKRTANNRQLEVFNQNVHVEVVDLPLCGRSNIITVEYNKKKYNISVNKNDCIQGKYKIGDIIEATYNPKLDIVNPADFIGVFRWNIIFLLIVLILFLLFIFRDKNILFSKSRRAKRL
jgi:uncharacterized membrane protein